MKGLFFILSISFSPYLFGQQYYSKTYDTFNHEHEDIRNVIAIDSILYMSCRGGCENNTMECFKFARFDLEGNYLGGYEETAFETGFGMETEGAFLYVDGGNEPINDKMFLNKISLDGVNNSLLELTYDSINFDLLVNKSVTRNINSIIVYGNLDDQDDLIDNKPKVKSLIFLISEDNFELDTTLILNPIYQSIITHDACSDNEGNVYFASSETLGNDLKSVHIYKMSKMNEIVWSYLHNQSYEASNVTEIQVINNQIIFTQHDEWGKDQLISIDTSGQFQWEYTFDHDEIKDVVVKRLKSTQDGHLLLAGQQRSGYLGWVDVGFIAKVSMDGKLLWERIFEVDKGHDPIWGEKFAKSGSFWDLEELPNGNLVAVGGLQNIYADPMYGLRHDEDLWIVKTDSTGCIVPGCGLVQSIQDGMVLVDSCKYLKEQAEWYFTPWSINCQETLSKVEVIGDTLIGNRMCSVLGVIENEELIQGSELIVFFESASEHVYFYEDEEFKLLYDFSLSVFPGDTLEFYLPQNFGYFDISSSNGAFVPNQSAYQLLVWDVLYINLPDGSQLRTMETQPIPNKEGECFDMGVILDGIGSRNGVLGRACSQLPSGCSEYFRCFESIDFFYSEVEGDCIVSSVFGINAAHIRIFPNPARGALAVKLSTPFTKQGELRFYNILGQLVETYPIPAGHEEYTISIKPLPAALYLYSLSVDHEVLTSGRLIKE